jgi:asparagine synthetase B (glutamine-hydrolysing)
VIEFVEQNHLVFGWGSGRYNFAEQHAPLHLAFGRSRSAPGDFREECVRTARAIADAAGKPVWVALSGGIDSEVIARSFREAGCDIRALTVRFDGGRNEHDIAYAAEFCAQHAIPQVIVDIDIGAFMRSCRDSRYVSNNVYRYMQMFIMGEVAERGGYCVMGSGEQRYELVGGRAVLRYRTEFTAPVHWMSDHGVRAAPYFFLHRPELIHAFAAEPEPQRLFAGELQPTKWAHNVKAAVYRRYWPQLAPRRKYSGYERVMEQRLETQAFLSRKWQGRLQELLVGSERLLGETCPRTCAPV